MAGNASQKWLIFTEFKTNSWRPIMCCITDLKRQRVTAWGWNQTHQSTVVERAERWIVLSLSSWVPFQSLLCFRVYAFVFISASDWTQHSSPVLLLLLSSCSWDKLGGNVVWICSGTLGSGSYASHGLLYVISPRKNLLYVCCEHNGIIFIRYYDQRDFNRFSWKKKTTTNYQIMGASAASKINASTLITNSLVR